MAIGDLGWAGVAFGNGRKSATQKGSGDSCTVTSTAVDAVAAGCSAANDDCCWGGGGGTMVDAVIALGGGVAGIGATG